MTPGKAAECAAVAEGEGRRGRAEDGDGTGRAQPKAQARAKAKPQDTTVSGPGSGGYVTFANLNGDQVNVQVGLSFVSVDGAKANLKAENTQQVVRHRRRGRARRRGTTSSARSPSPAAPTRTRTTFYTALYHSLMQPNVFSDVDGQYPGFDGRIHKADKGHAMYTNFSGWDIYRSEVAAAGDCSTRQRGVGHRPVDDRPTPSRAGRGTAGRSPTTTPA